jgi:hypothetical protein
MTIGAAIETYWTPAGTSEWTLRGCIMVRGNRVEDVRLGTCVLADREWRWHLSSNGMTGIAEHIHAAKSQAEDAWLTAAERQPKGATK